MPHDVPDSEPTKIRAGESWKWDRTLSDHPPSDGWTLKYALRGPTDADFEADTDDDTYEIRVDPATTEGFSPGTYRLVGFVEKGDPVTDREVVYEDALYVEANPLTAVGEKTHAEKVYDAVTAVLEGNATKEQRRFTVNGREVERWPVSELLTLRNVYADQIRMERRPGKTLQPVEARFGAP